MEQSPVSITERNAGQAAVITVGEWLVTMLIAAIPVVNVVMLFVWAFGSNTKLSKANWAKATLIFLVIAVVFYLVVIVAFIGGSPPCHPGTDRKAIRTGPGRLILIRRAIWCSVLPVGA